MAGGNKKKVATGVVHTSDRLQDEQQARTRAVTQAHNATPFALAGPIIPGVVFVANQVVAVKHRLGRKPNGYLTVRHTAGANDQREVVRVTTQTLDETIYIQLVCATSSTRDLLFF